MKKYSDFTYHVITVCLIDFIHIIDPCEDDHGIEDCKDSIDIWSCRHSNVRRWCKRSCGLCPSKCVNSVKYEL